MYNKSNIKEEKNEKKNTGIQCIIRSRQYLTETITDAANTDDQVLLAYKPSQARSLLHSLQQAARGIVLYENVKK